MICVLILIVAAVAAPDAEQTALLKTFRGEFIAITPGKGKYPKTLVTVDPTSKKGSKEVVMTYDFSIGKYEVTQDVWKSVMGSNPSVWKGPTRKRNSVEMISFDESVAFCKKTTQLLRAAKLIDDSEEVRLPTEAEWEYVARAGTKTTYSFGDHASQLDDYAWSTQNAAGNDPVVGEKKPNPWGLYDVHGYLWEWCAREDVKQEDVKQEIDDESERIIRGGSWKDAPDKLTSSYRVSVAKKLKDDAIGLRCVLAKVKPRSSKK